MKNKKGLIIAASVCAVILIVFIVLYLMNNDSFTRIFRSDDEIETTAQTFTAKEVETTKASKTPTSGLTPVYNTTMKVERGDNNSYVVQYPEISGMNNESTQAKVNEEIKNNALKILEAYPIDTKKDKLSVDCTVNYIDRKRASLIYTGTLSKDGGEAKEIIYTNTLDLTSAKSLDLTTFATPTLLASYLVSDDVQVVGASKSELEEIKTLIAKKKQSAYKSMLTNADFPLKIKNTWPEVFSYDSLGDIYFSIPVSGSWGDYALVKFVPVTK